MVRTKTYIFPFFYQQDLVLFTMAPRNAIAHLVFVRTASKNEKPAKVSLPIQNTSRNVRALVLSPSLRKSI